MRDRNGFDLESRRPAIRRTVWLLFGLAALIYGAFFLRAILRS
jgi:hypothetical protein